MKVDLVTHTNGRGYWTDVKAEVRIINVYLNFVNNSEDDEWGELHAEFDRKNWNPELNGDIYTDPLWLKEFNNCLISMGGTPIDYSEQGMQGDTFVSCDVDKKFLKSKLGKELKKSL